MSFIEDNPPVLLPCSICSRTFRSEILERHTKVCEKSATKKRKVFDSFKNRVSGTELEEFLGPSPVINNPVKKPERSTPRKAPISAPKWKETHESLIAILRAARGVEDESPVIVNKHTGNEQCPSCNRYFGPRAFDRHVEFCKEKTSRIKAMPSKVSQAQERLEARTKYRAPLMVKQKLTTRDKYSPMLPRKLESTEFNTVSTKTLASTSSPSSRHSKTLIEKTNQSSILRESPSRLSQRQRSVSPLKKTSVSNSKGTGRNEIMTKQSSQLQNTKNSVKELDDIRTKIDSQNTSPNKLRDSNTDLIMSQNESNDFQSRDRAFQDLRNNYEGDSFTGNCFGDKSNSQAEKDSNIQSLNEHLKNRFYRPIISTDLSYECTRKARKSKKSDEKIFDDERISSRFCLSEKNMSPRDKLTGRQANSEHKTNTPKSDFKSTRKLRKKPIVNDLSVNDESYGIFVDACSFGPMANSKIKSHNDRSSYESVESKEAGNNANFYGERSPEMDSLGSSPSPGKNDSMEERGSNKNTSGSEKTGQNVKDKVSGLTYRASKIPKSTSDFAKSSKTVAQKSSSFDNKKVQSSETLESYSKEDVKTEKTLSECEESRSERKFSKTEDGESVRRDRERTAVIRTSSFEKWRNINKWASEDPLQAIGTFGGDTKASECNRANEVGTVNGGDNFLSPTRVWEIAAEQFLNSRSPETSEFVNHCSTNANPSLSAKADGFSLLKMNESPKLLKSETETKGPKNQSCLTALGSNYQDIAKKINMDVVVFTATSSLPKKTFPKKHKKEKHIKVEGSAVKESKVQCSALPNILSAKRRKMSTQEECNASLKFPMKDLKRYTPKLEECFKDRTIAPINETEAKSKIKIGSMYSDECNLPNPDTVKVPIKNSVILTNGSTGKYFALDQHPLANKENGTYNVSARVNISRGKGITNLPVPQCEYKEVTEKNQAPMQKNLDEIDQTLEVFGTVNYSPSKIRCHFKNYDLATDKEIIDSPSKRTGNGNERQAHSEMSSYVVEGGKQIIFEKKITDMTCKLDLLNQDVKNDVLVHNEQRSVDEKSTLQKKNAFKCPDGVGLMKIESNSFSIIKQRPKNEVDTCKSESHQEKSLESNLILRPLNSHRQNIEIEDFILKKPEENVYISNDQKCLEKFFPKTEEILSYGLSKDSSTAIKQDLVIDSVFELKSSSKKSCTDLPRLGVSSRILKKRPNREGALSNRIAGARADKKGNSMESLVKIWKDKQISIQENSEGTPVAKKYQKLSPLKLKNSPSTKPDGKGEAYDPFKQAERQMLALLSWPSTADIKTQLKSNSSAGVTKLKPKSKPQPQSRLNPSSCTNLETSPTSAFTRYSSETSKNEQMSKNVKDDVNHKKLFYTGSEAFPAEKKNERTEFHDTYSGPDDWEEIFEKQFDLNQNEMSDKLTKSVKATLDGLLKSPNYSSFSDNNSNLSALKINSELSDSSIIEDVNFTSTPKNNQTSTNLGKKSEGNKDSGIFRKKSKSPVRRNMPLDSLNSTFNKKTESKIDRLSPERSLSKLSFNSRISDNTVLDEGLIQSLEIVGFNASKNRKKTPRSQSALDDRNQMLFAKTFDQNFSSSDENELESSLGISHKNLYPSKSPFHEPIPSHFRRSELVVDNKCKGDGIVSDEGDQISSPDSNNRRTKMSGDSAYSSLSRRSPRVIEQQYHHAEDRLSSSGSEHSLPPMSHDQPFKPKSLNFNNDPLQSKKEKPFKMSKFCHECGSKYPIPIAKFCCECGVRRLII